MTPFAEYFPPKLRDAWLADLSVESGSSGSTVIDVLDWLGHMALDIIGESGELRCS